MDLLKELVDSLDTDAKKEFKTFLNRYRKRESRKDLLLFNFYCKEKEISRDLLIKKIYGDSKKLEAYHGTRRRLLKQLTEFVSSRVRSEAVETERQVENLLVVANHLFAKNREEPAWSFLKQAEEMAEKIENFRLVNNILSIQIEKFQSEFASDLKLVIEKKEKYQKLAVEDDNASIAYQVIRYEIQNSLRESTSIDIEVITDNVLRKYNLIDRIALRPKMMFNIIAITRSAILARKEFYLFESFVEERYQELERREVFNQFNHQYKLSILYMIAHVKYRNKRFSEALEYLNELYESMILYNKSHYFLMYPRYILLLAALKNYSGNNSEAIEILEKFLKEKGIKIDKIQELNTYLNLSTYYFQKELYNKSIRVFQNIGHSDNWLSKIMGREWVLKKNIIELINQFELGNADIVEKRIKNILKNFADLIGIPMYERVKTFLLLVNILNNDPGKAATKEFKDKVMSSFEFISTELEDIQAMTFYGWLKGKMENRNYYEALLDMVRLKQEGA